MSNHLGMFEDAKAGELCDLELECEGLKLTVHKIVVWNQSEVIKTACKSKFKEGRTNVVQIPDFSLATVKRMVEYMYLGDYSFENDPRWASEPAQSTVDTISDSRTAAASDTSSDSTACAESDSDSTSSTESDSDSIKSTPPTTAEALRPHLEMSMIAGYYMLPGLEALALKKINTASEQIWSPEGFDELVAEVHPSIPHEATRKHLSDLVVEHLDDFPSNETLFPDPFSRQVISTLEIKLAEAMASHDVLTERSSVSEVEKIGVEQKLRQLKVNLENLKDICRCRHCGNGFHGYLEFVHVDGVACIIRCRGCRTRHYGH